MNRRPVRAGAFLVALALIALCPRSSFGQVHFTPIVGGLPADSGFTAGIELLRYRTIGPYDARARFMGSIKKYEHVELSLESPPPATHDFFSEIRFRYRNYPEDDFWGLGPDTSESSRTNYRLEDIRLSFGAGLHYRNGLRIAGVVGLTETNVGPGKDRDHPSTETLFSEVTAPGLGSAPDYWYGGVEIDLDRRDNRENPAGGDFAAFSWTRFADRADGDFSFDRYTAEYRRFLALGSGRRLAGRARFITTSEFDGHRIPIFLEPSVGGTDTLRGFHQYRFRSGSSLVFNLEYRHDLMGFLTGIVFADAGRVAEGPMDLDFGGLRGSAGGGVRVGFGDRVLFGVDVGASSEGTHLWFRSGHTF
jgi:hypothetical protein